jgi:hypothetical protein
MSTSAIWYKFTRSANTRQTNFSANAIMQSSTGILRTFYTERNGQSRKREPHREDTYFLCTQRAKFVKSGRTTDAGHLLSKRVEKYQHQRLEYLYRDVPHKDLID